MNEQFDTYTRVIWQPYTEAAINARYLGGMSVLCTRDRDYWMTKSKIIFDIFVEEMAQHMVMKQFGLLQLELPPPLQRTRCHHTSIGINHFSNIALSFIVLNSKGMTPQLSFIIAEHTPQF